jgi:carbonic anhydrase
LELAKRDPNQSIRALTEENVRVQVHNVRKVPGELNLTQKVKAKGFMYHIAERELREIDVPGPL